VTPAAERGGAVDGLLTELGDARRLAAEVDRPDLAERLDRAAA
jgi:hypothetical protein